MGQGEGLDAVFRVLGVQRRLAASGVKGQMLVVAVQQNLIAALGQGITLVVHPHHQGVRRLADTQAGVYAHLHAAGAAVVVPQDLTGGAVLVGVVAGHGVAGAAILAVKLLRCHQAAGLVIDGLDQLPLRLVGKAAQVGEGPLDQRAGVADAVLHRAAPEYILQRHGVVVDLEARHPALYRADQGVVELGLGIVILSRTEGIAVGLVHLTPLRVKAGAVAGRGIAVGVHQLVADIPVHAAVGAVLAPAGKLHRGARLAGEHVQAVGLAAGVAGGGGDTAGAVAAVADLIVAAQVVILGIVPLQRRLGDGADEKAAAHQTQHDGKAQQQCGASP